MNIKAILYAVMTIAVVSSKCSSIAADERFRRLSTGAVNHIEVYAVPNRFGGWPANHGIWSWKNEILVGFSAGHFKDNGPGRHAIDHEKPEEHLLARSLDGGVHWSIENPSEHGALIPIGHALHGITPPGLKERRWQDCLGINFEHPDFAMTFRMTDHHAGPSRFSFSYDRGKTWEGPYRLTVNDPSGIDLGIAARTDSIVNGPQDCLIFLTASKKNGREGRPFCARTTDGAKSWKFVSWIGVEPIGYSIMPSSIRLGKSELLSTIRRRDEAKSWIESHRSINDGQDWKLETNLIAETGEGNPPSLLRLTDGRICLTYGYRAEPYEIRAQLSDDSGRTWNRQWILRTNGGGRDIGYPVSIQRPDGKIVTIYYFHDQALGDRYIAATIWDPNEP